MPPSPARPPAYSVWWWSGFCCLAAIERCGPPEQAAAQKAILLQGTLDNVREGIAAFDREGKLEAFNARFFRLLRLPPELANIGLPIGALRDAEVCVLRRRSATRCSARSTVGATASRSLSAAATSRSIAT